MQRFLILNPRSGTGSPGPEELRDWAGISADKVVRAVRSALR